MAKRSPAIKYTCGLCQKPAPEQPEGSALELLQLCSGCQEKRFAAGMAAQKRALAAEASRAG